MGRERGRRMVRAGDATRSALFRARPQRVARGSAPRGRTGRAAMSRPTRHDCGCTSTDRAWVTMCDKHRAEHADDGYDDDLAYEQSREAGAL